VQRAFDARIGRVHRLDHRIMDDAREIRSEIREFPATGQRVLIRFVRRRGQRLQDDQHEDEGG
jgi:hypothetical protein